MRPLKQNTFFLNAGNEIAGNGFALFHKSPVNHRDSRRTLPQDGLKVEVYRTSGFFAVGTILGHSGNGTGRLEWVSRRNA